MNAAYSQLEIRRRIKITWIRSNDATVTDVECKCKPLLKEKNQDAQGWNIGLRAKGWPKEYPSILEIFAIQARPSWLLIRSLKLIFRYKYQLAFVSERSNYISLDEITG